MRRLDTDGDASVNFSEWSEFLRSPAALPLPAPVPPVPAPRPYPSYYYSRLYDWPYSRYYDDWKYDSYLDYKYGSPYYPSYSRYYPLSRPWYSRYYDPLYAPETKTVTYDVERPTPYSPARTVKRETYHSPVRPPRTYTSYL